MRLFGTALLVIVVACIPCHAGDSIRPANTADGTAGVLVDGFRDQATVNDARYTTLDLGTFFNAFFPVIPLNSFTLAAEGNEIIAFSPRRAPLLVDDVPWTPGDNTIHVIFDDAYAIPLYVWIVQGPFEDVSATALDASVATSAIWNAERQGLQFSIFEIRDATEDPDAGPLVEFTCNKAADLKSLIGHRPDGVNVYYVNTVDFGQGPSTSNGVWCGVSHQIIAMGRNTRTALLAHELGHAFQLGHTQDDEAHFDSTNVMHNSSSNRRYLTEGQNFRAIFNSYSSINLLYDVRAGEVTRSCGHATFDFACPVIYKRIWDDGPSWPPN